MHIPTIDREEAIIHFRQLLELESPLRILRLVGAPKMGKTHLLTKVFRRIAEQQAAHCTVIDLRNPQQTITTHLHNTCSQIGYCHFPTFDRAYTEWLNRPQIQITGLRAIFANFSVRASSESFNTDHVIPHLTRCFVSDLQKLNARIVVLIFDQMDNVAPETQAWLMEVLLVQLQRLAHVRVVVGGCTMPEALGSYAMCCRDYELAPVQKDSAYIDYCQKVGASLEEQSIRDVAKALLYAPGAFAEAVLVFCVPKDVPHG